MKDSGKHAHIRLVPLKMGVLMALMSQIQVIAAALFYVSLDAESGHRCPIVVGLLSGIWSFGPGGQQTQHLRAARWGNRGAWRLRPSLQSFLRSTTLALVSCRTKPRIVAETTLTSRNEQVFTSCISGTGGVAPPGVQLSGPAM